MSLVPKQKGFLLKLLRLITVVNPHEVRKALLLACNIFLILAAYYMLKIVRDATVLEDYGANTKNLMSGIQVILLIFVIKAFSALASRVNREKLISRVTIFFIMNLGIIYILFVTGALGRAMSIVYFIWVGIFNVLVIAQFWGFTIDLYSEEDGKRLFPIIMFGANFGGLAGAASSKLLVDPKAINPMVVYQLIIIAAIILAFCIFLTKYIHKREIGQKAFPDKTEQEKPLEKEGGFRLVFQSRYLLYIAIFVLLLNLINTTGEWIVDSVFELATDEAVKGGIIVGESTLANLAHLKANFFIIVNALALFIQVVIVSRLFKWFGVRAAVFVLPFIAFGGNIAMSLGASLVVVVWAKALENSTDYSLTNTTRHALFLITTREEKYKAKVAIDAFFQRAGDIGSMLLVGVASGIYALNIESVARINIAVAIVWILLCFLIAKEHKKLKSQDSV
jgi:AAA family ATP:ADP antiporter